MGTFIHTVCVPTGDNRHVSEHIARWLDRKGFAPLTTPPRFPTATDDERGCFLVSNDRWTVVLYSALGGFEPEGERLIYELGGLDLPLLRLFVHDSDAWGYQIIKDRKTVSGFVSPARFADEASPNDGDIDYLCETFGFGGRELELEQIMRRRHLFKEVLMLRFCAILDIAGATLDYRDLDEQFLGREPPKQIGGCRVMRLRFRREGSDPSRTSIDLHALAVREPTERTVETDAPAELPPQWRAHIEQIRQARMALAPIVWLLSGVVRAAFVLEVLVHKLAPRAFERRFADPLALAFDREACPPHVTLDGRVLINGRHRLALTLSEGVEPTTGGLLSDFGFRIGERDVRGEVLAPAAADERIRALFRLQPGARVIDDQRYVTGQHPARGLYVQQRRPDQAFWYETHVVHTPDAFVFFTIHGKDAPIPDTTRATLRRTIETLREVEPAGA